MLVDLVPFNRNYVNNTNFVDGDLVDRHYTEDQVNSEILKDNSYFRV